MLDTAKFLRTQPISPVAPGPSPQMAPQPADPFLANYQRNRPAGPMMQHAMTPEGRAEVLENPFPIPAEAACDASQFIAPGERPTDTPLSVHPHQMPKGPQFQQVLQPTLSTFDRRSIASMQGQALEANTPIHVPAGQVHYPRVGVILTGYRRINNLAHQLQAIRTQSVPFHELVVWGNDCNNSGGGYPDLIKPKESYVLTYDKNWGVWPRFLIGLQMESDYIAVFDDDTIPGRNWFENCFKVLDACGPTLLGSCGVVFPTGEREPAVGLGWKAPCDDTVAVDIVGHAWFFHRDLLRDFAQAPPSIKFHTAGEDYWLSYCAQRRGMAVACPPHPENNKEMWGSLYGLQLGTDGHAIYAQPGEPEKKAHVHNVLRAIGWRPNAASMMPDGEQVKVRRLTTNR